MAQPYKVLSVTQWDLKAFSAAALSFAKGYLCWKKRDPKSKKDPTLRSLSPVYICVCMCISKYTQVASLAVTALSVCAPQPSEDHEAEACLPCSAVLDCCLRSKVFCVFSPTVR